MKRALIALSASVLFVSASWSSCYAGNVYPTRVIDGFTTGEVDEIQFSTNDVGVVVTNLPGGGRRVIIAINAASGSALTASNLWTGIGKHDGSIITQVVDMAGFGAKAYTNATGVTANQFIVFSNAPPNNLHTTVTLYGVAGSSFSPSFTFSNAESAANSFSFVGTNYPASAGQPFEFSFQQESNNLVVIKESGGTNPVAVAASAQQVSSTASNFTRVFNVRDFGATGTTNADSAAAINAAIITLANTPASNGVRTLKIPYGLYGLNTPGTNTVTSRNPLFFDLSGINGPVIIDSDNATLWVTSTNLESYFLPFGGVMEGAVLCVSSNVSFKGALTVRGTGIQTNNTAIFFSGFRLQGPGGNNSFDGVTVRDMPGKGWSPVLNTNDNASVMYTGPITTYKNCQVLNCGNIALHSSGVPINGITVTTPSTTIDGCTLSNIVGLGVSLYYTYGNSNSLAHIYTRTSTFDDCWGNSSSPVELTVENLNAADSSNEAAFDIEVSGCHFHNSTLTNQGHEAMLTLLGGDPGSGSGPQRMMQNVRVFNNDFSTAIPNGTGGPDGGFDMEGRIVGIAVYGNTATNLVYGIYENDTHSTNLTYGLSLVGNAGSGCGYAFQMAGHGTDQSIGANSAFGGGGWSIGNSTNINFAGGDYSQTSTGFFVSGSHNIQKFDPTNSNGRVVGNLITSPNRSWSIPVEGALPPYKSTMPYSVMFGQNWPTAYWGANAGTIGFGICVPNEAIIGSNITCIIDLFGINGASTIPMIAEIETADSAGNLTIYNGGSVTLSVPNLGVFIWTNASINIPLSSNGFPNVVQVMIAATNASNANAVGLLRGRLEFKNLD